MIVRINVHGEANAQALFDVFARRGVTWSPGRNGWHTLYVAQRYGENLKWVIQDLFPRLGKGQFSVDR